jgi:hypothetical protein
VKIFLQEKSNHETFETLVREFEGSLQLPVLATRTAEQAP